MNYFISIEDGVIKGLTISRGVVCLRVPSFHGIDSLVDYAIKSSLEMNLCKRGESVIVIQGNYADHPTTPNLLKIVYVN
jgi:pyruvate kinase